MAREKLHIVGLLNITFTNLKYLYLKLGENIHFLIIRYQKFNYVAKSVLELYYTSIRYFFPMLETSLSKIR